MNKTIEFRQVRLGDTFNFNGKEWTKTAYFPSLDHYGRNAVADDGEREILGEPTIVETKP